MTRWALEFRLPHREHQAHEWDLHRDARARALHWTMRTGKTKAMVDLACYRYELGQVDRIVVVAQNNVHANWPLRELPKHHWLLTPHRTLTWRRSESHGKAFKERFQEFCVPDGRLKWFFINSEALSDPHAKRFLADFVRRRRFGLIVDEVHDFRRPGSKRSQAVRAMAPRAAFVRILSGTMVDNDPLHAWAEYELLAKGALGYEKYGDFEKFFAEFEDKTFYAKRKGGGAVQRTVKAVAGYKNQDVLRERMAAWTSYVHREDVDLSELVPSEVSFELEPEQRRLYNEMAGNGLARLESGEVIQPVEGAQLITKLQQVASGYYVDEEGRVHELVKLERNPRLGAMVERVRACEGKVVVWCRFRQDIVWVLDRLRAEGIGAVDFYGGTKTKDRPKNEAAFRDDPRVKVLVGQPQACGQGLDFSTADDILWYSHVHGNLIVRRQADERATEMGGGAIGVTDLVAAGTVDEKMLEDRDEKIERTDYLTGEGLRRYLELIP